jgi:hypothetical protein
MKPITKSTLRCTTRTLAPTCAIIPRRARRNKGRQIALPLLLLIAGLMLAHPCAGAPFEFETTGSLTTPRLQHTATLLSNGKVLVTGGTNLFGTFASAELYDPVGGTWKATGSLATPRTHHTATLLRNGKVLVTGGQDFNTGALASAELYDPTSGRRRPPSRERGSL